MPNREVETLEEKLGRLDAYDEPCSLLRDLRLSPPVHLRVGKGIGNDDIYVRADTREQAVDEALRLLEARYSENEQQAQGSLFAGLPVAMCP